MSPRLPAARSGPTAGEPAGDPWAAFGYLVSGVVFYGAIGLGLSVWLHAPWLIPVGIVVGAGFGMYLVFVRFRYRESDQTATGSAEPRSGRDQTRPGPSTDRGDAQ